MSLSESIIKTQPRSFGLWPSVWRLLRLRVRIMVNTFKRSKTSGKVGAVVVGLLLIGLMVGLFAASSGLLRLMRSPELAAYIDPNQMIGAIPTLVLTAAFFLTLMTNFGVLLQALYLSHDMDFLITSPLPMRAVFLSKLIEAILPNFALFCAFTLPVLFGLGVSSGYSVLYYPLVIAVLALMALAAGGLASILVMAVVRVVPAKRVAEVLGFLGATLAVLCGQSANIIDRFNIDQSDFGGMLSTLSQLDSMWSPFAWAGRGVAAVGEAQWLNGLLLTGLSVIVLGGVFAASLLAAEQLYYTGWSSMQGSARRKKPVSRQNEAREPRFEFGQLLPAPVRGVAVKDLLTLRRDPRNYSQLITPLILGVVMLFSSRGGGGDMDEQLTGLGLANLEVYGLITVAVFIGWMLMFNLSSMSFTREGKSYWMLKTSPVRPGHLLVGKFIVSYLPSITFTLIFLTVAFLLQGANWLFFPYCALVLALVIAGANGISLAFGTMAADLSWESPNRQRLRGGAGCAAVLIVMAFLAFDLALFLLPVALWQIFAGSAPFLAYLVGAVLGGAAAALVIFLSMQFAIPRLEQIGEPE